MLAGDFDPNPESEEHCRASIQHPQTKIQDNLWIHIPMRVRLIVVARFQHVAILVPSAVKEHSKRFREAKDQKNGREAKSSSASTETTARRNSFNSKDVGQEGPTMRGHHRLSNIVLWVSHQPRHRSWTHCKSRDGINETLLGADRGVE